jgi:hypothetical protein
MSIFRKTLVALIVATAAAGSACGPAQVTVAATTPRLVWISPGIWLVEDYPWPVYYADGYYWRSIDGVWYRSLYYDDAFARIDVSFVPRIVIGSHRPAVHVRYRAPRGARVRVIDHRTRQPVVIRDHRR